MRFYGIAEPEQLDMLAQALDEYCTDNGFEPGSHHREKAALALVAAFESGARTAKELRARLERVDIHFAQIKALTRDSMDKKALDVCS